MISLLRWTAVAVAVFATATPVWAQATSGITAAQLNRQELKHLNTAQATHGSDAYGHPPFRIFFSWGWGSVWLGGGWHHGIWYWRGYDRHYDG